MMRAFGVVLLWGALSGLAGCGGGGASPGGSDVSVTLESNRVSASATQSDADLDRYVNVRVSGDLTKASLYLGVQATHNGVALANVTGVDLSFVQIQIRFRAAGTLPVATYADTVDLYACFDVDCKQPVPGSPFQIKTSYAVTASSAVAAPTALTVPDSALLAHDVVDAALSKALDAVVMVSASPTSALYVYDLATRTERSIALGKVPTSLSISPDGLNAAVGHDALISYVGLGGVGRGATPKVLNVSAPVFDLILDGTGHVHVFPAADQWVALHTVSVASNTEVMTGLLYAKTVAKLAPSGDSFYAVDTLLTPQNINRYTISSDGVASRTGQSPYWGDFPMCSGLWFSEDGATVYTPCGNTFRGSDLVYSGRLPLTYNLGNYYKPIVDLSESASRHEIALLDAGWCGSQGGADCDTVLRLIASDADFTPLAAFWAEPVPVAGRYYPLHGMFVFHGSGGEKWTISRLAGADGRDARSYLWTPVTAANAPAARTGTAVRRFEPAAP